MRKRTAKTIFVLALVPATFLILYQGWSSARLDVDRQTRSIDYEISDPHNWGIAFFGICLIVAAGIYKAPFWKGRNGVCRTDLDRVHSRVDECVEDGRCLERREACQALIKQDLTNFESRIGDMINNLSEEVKQIGKHLRQEK